MVLLLKCHYIVYPENFDKYQNFHLSEIINGKQCFKIYTNSSCKKILPLDVSHAVILFFENLHQRPSRESYSNFVCFGII